MSHNICAEFKRSAVDRGCECIVNNKRYTVLMCKSCKLFKIKNGACRISNCLTKDTLRIRLDILAKLLVRKLLVDKCAFDAHLCHCNSEKIVSSAVDR